MKTEILYGIHSTREAVRAGRRTIFKICVSGKKTSKRLYDVVSLAESKNIPVEEVPQSGLKRLLQVENHQGICARVSAYPLVDMSLILGAFGHGMHPPMVLLLDHIVDPQNLGALIRTALCVGTDAVFIPKDRAALPTPTVSRASAGALEHVRMSQVTNMVATIQTMKRLGFWIIGLDREAMDSIYTADFTGPLALVIGGEEKGVRSLVKRHCDTLVSIPQNHTIDSLNASVAGAVAMYEAFRQRRSIDGFFN
jgi:23S rRNA (guanosine2251-2'-O)-methyltransferase